MAEPRLPQIGVQPRDVVHLDALGARGLAGAVVGAVAEAFLVVLSTISTTRV
jgi:hypothetical protein